MLLHALRLRLQPLMKRQFHGSGKAAERPPLPKPRNLFSIQDRERIALLTALINPNSPLTVRFDPRQRPAKGMTAPGWFLTLGQGAGYGQNRSSAGDTTLAMALTRQPAIVDVSEYDIRVDCWEGGPLWVL